MKKKIKKRRKNPPTVLHQTICRVTLDIAIKARRVDISTHQVLIEIGCPHGKVVVRHWLLGASGILVLSELAMICKIALICILPWSMDH